jgi:hypothetical protein
MPSSLTESENLFDFFHEKVGTAVCRQGSGVSEEGIFYLTNLLVDQGRAPDEAMDTTLVELHLRAQEGTRSTAIHTYRTLGDRALVLSGFFRQSLARKLVSLEYYMGMGSAAYGRLSHLLHEPSGLLVGDQAGHKALDEVFAELANCFAACSEVLKEVRQQVQAEVAQGSDQVLLHMYEHWLETGDPSAGARLRELGLLPPVRGPDDSAC